MSLVKRTIPYASVDESRDQPFTEDLQLASLYILGDVRRETDPLSAMTLIHYPFQFRRVSRGILLIDMLGLNQTTFKVNVMPDVGGFSKRLDAASEDPDTLLKLLSSNTAYFKAFSGQRTVTIKGLLSCSGKIEEVQTLLNKAVEFDQKPGAMVFKSVLRERDVKAIFSSLSSLRNDIARDEKSLEEMKRSFTAALGVAKKVLKEETQNIKDSSGKIKNRMRGNLKKKRDRLRKKLNRDTAKVRERYRKQAKPLRDERVKLKRRIARLEKRIERLRLKGDSEAVEAQRSVLRDVMRNFRKMDDAVKELDARRDSEVKEARDQYQEALKVEEDKIKAEDEGAKAEMQERLDLGSKLEAEARGILKQIDALIRRKRNKLNSLSKFFVDLEVEDMELLLPFYVFQYGEKRFDFQPPVAVAGSRGLFSRFRRMLADSVGGRLNILIRPQGVFTEKYLEKAVRSLGRNTALARVYRRDVEELNLFRSLGGIYSIMRGLVRMRREGWISDVEYIRFQETLVDQLGLMPGA